MSPFRSEAQRRKLWATNPDVARKFEAETPKGSDLPERVKPKKKAPHSRAMPKPPRPKGPGKTTGRKH